MKKSSIVLIASIGLMLACIVTYSISNNTVYYLFNKNPLQDELQINYEGSKNSPTFDKLQKLTYALRAKGVVTNLNLKNEHKTSDINLYVASDDYKLPIVIDSNAINILWIPYVDPNEDFNNFRNFDVVIVKSISSFSHLKAVNVRTAYIPDAFEVKYNKSQPQKGAVFWGDNDNYSLSLNLANGLNLDIFGAKWNRTIFHSKVIKENNIKISDFVPYTIVLIDQDDDDLRKELINDKIIKLIEHGIVPFIRYNPGVYSIFGEAVPQYYNVDDFYYKFNNLTKNHTIIQENKEILFNIAKKWNYESQANKFIEIFSIMQKKRIK